MSNPKRSAIEAEAVARVVERISDAKARKAFVRNPSAALKSWGASDVPETVLETLKTFSEEQLAALASFNDATAKALLGVAPASDQVERPLLFFH